MWLPITFPSGANGDGVDADARPYIQLKDNMVDQDPLFGDRPRYRLRADSPAYAIGFKPIPFEKIGLYKDEYRRDVPGK